MKRNFTSAIVLVLLALSAVNCALFENNKNCQYMDNNVVDKLDNKYAEVIVSVHTKEATDLVDQYKARFDFNNAKYVTSEPATCFRINYKDGKFYNIAGYYRVPLVKSAKDIKFWQIPDNSYVFFPIGTSNVTDNGYNNFANWDDLLFRSAFQSPNVTNPYGYMFAENDKGGFNYILRNIYMNNAGLAIPATADITDVSGCNLKTESMNYRNCPVIHGPLLHNEIYTGPRDYFFSTYKTNFCVWLMAIVILAYFIWAVGTSTNDPTLPHYENNSWFNHPYYSIYVFGNPQQTKIARLTLLLDCWFATIFACAFTHRGLVDKDEGTRVGAGLAVGFGLQWIMVYFFSYFLNKLTRVHGMYLEDYKACTTHDQKIEAAQKYDNRRAHWNYLFYTLSFGWVMGCAWGSQGLTAYFGNTENWYFMLSIGIVLFGQALVFDFLAVLLGRGHGAFARFIQYRAYYIDYELHKKFDSFLADQDS